MQFPPISTFLKYCNYYLKALDIWSIICMKDDKMHKVKLVRMLSMRT